MFADNRNVVSQLQRCQLSAAEQDDFVELASRMRRIHTCAFCGTYYTLGASLGDTTACSSDSRDCSRRSRRDHVDYQTEACDEWDEFAIPYKFALCLQSEKLLPAHIACHISAKTGAALGSKAGSLVSFRFAEGEAGGQHATPTHVVIHRRSG